MLLASGKHNQDGEGQLPTLARLPNGRESWLAVLFQVPLTDRQQHQMLGGLLL